MLQVQRFANQTRGSTGIRVRMAQRLLNRAGARPELADDGIFGPKTQAAVKDYQRVARIPVTGVIGRRTWDSLQVGGRGSATSTNALAARALMIYALTRLATSFLRGARLLAQTSDPNRARTVLRASLGRARSAYRLAAGMMALDTAFSVRQRRGADTLRLVFLLSEVIPAQAPAADPRALAGPLRQAGEYAAMFTLILQTLPPAKFVEVAPGLLQALATLVFHLSSAADGLAVRPAGAPSPAPATPGP
jgi:hypothetical protein